MNLWDLKIEKIPCGWDKTYQYALIHCPNGEMLKFQELDKDDKLLVTKTFFHPVQCHNLLVEQFNILKNQASNLIAKRSQLDLTNFVSQLVEIDVCLYNLLDRWRSSDKNMDCTSYNPENFLEIRDYDFYVDDTYADTMFYQLRLINRPIE